MVRWKFWYFLGVQRRSCPHCGKKKIDEEAIEETANEDGFKVIIRNLKK